MPCIKVESHSGTGIATGIGSVQGFLHDTPLPCSTDSGAETNGWRTMRITSAVAVARTRSRGPERSTMSAGDEGWEQPCMLTARAEAKREPVGNHAGASVGDGGVWCNEFHGGASAAVLARQCGAVAWSAMDGPFLGKLVEEPSCCFFSLNRLVGSSCFCARSGWTMSPRTMATHASS